MGLASFIHFCLGMACRSLVQRSRKRHPGVCHVQRAVVVAGKSPPCLSGGGSSTFFWWWPTVVKQPTPSVSQPPLGVISHSLHSLLITACCLPLAVHVVPVLHPVRQQPSTHSPYPAMWYVVALVCLKVCFCLRRCLAQLVELPIKQCTCPCTCSVQL